MSDDLRTVRIHEDLVVQIEDFLEDNDLGYTSRKAVVEAAVREFLERRTVDKQADDVLDRLESEMLELIKEKRRQNR